MIVAGMEMVQTTESLASSLSVVASVSLGTDRAGVSRDLNGLEDTPLRMLPSSTGAFAVALTCFSTSGGSMISIGA